MVKFMTAPVEDVAPKSKQRQPSMRAQVQEQYQEALRDAVERRHEALVVELDSADKPLTIRNRLKRASEVLGMDDVVIRRRGNRMVAYRSPQTGAAE